MTELATAVCAGAERVESQLLGKVRQHARTRGDAVAVAAGSTQVTYRELWDWAGRAARGLLAAGRRPGEPVATRLPSSIELIPAALGILRAGMVYLPLDPQGPPVRRNRILDGSGADLVIVSGVDGMGGNAGRPAVRIADLIGGPPVRPDWQVPVAPDSPCYLIYTSGSTGKPKGVVVSHRNLNAYLTAIAPRYRLSPSDVVLQFASPEFDISLEDISNSLAAGARLVCRPPDLLGSVHRFLDYCATHGVTVLNLPTGYWHWLTNQLAEHRLPLPASIRQVMMGGEQVLANHLAAWQDAFGREIRVINTYGPSETTPTVTTADLQAREPTGTPPIGTPLPGVEAHLLTEQQGPTGEGELHLGGPVVGLGYWAEPRPTATRFVPDPHSGRLGARLYRSGDRVARDQDGMLVFAGRNDGQVKIAGHRVELAEVESVLRESPRVRDAAVVPVREGSGPVRGLAAFLVPAGEPPTAGEIVELMAARLPGMARPAVVRVVPDLPLGHTGKVDRAALNPEKDGTRLVLGTEYAAPADRREEEVAAIFADVLDAGRVGRDDDFLTLGGNSLLAIQVASRLEEELGVDLPVSTILRGTTVADLAAMLEPSVLAVAGATPGSGTGESSPDGLVAPMSLTQERVWFMLELDPEDRSYQFQMYLRIHGDLMVEALRRALTELVNRHEILRTTFGTVDGEPVQLVHEPYEVALPVLDADEVEAAGGVEDVTSNECARRFDPGTLPLIRWLLLRLGSQEYRLVHVEHHMLHDGWSLGVLLTDLAYSYRAIAAGQRPAWPSPAPRFRDYARAQRRWLDSAQARRQEDFWRAKLAGAPAVTALPTDRPRPERPTSAGRVHTCVVRAELARRVAEFADQRRATVFAIMLTAFAVLVHRYTGQRDLLLGTSVANRGGRDLAGLIGMMVNNLVLRLQVPEHGRADMLVDHVRDAVLEAFDHRQLPFDRVVAQSSLASDPRMNPLFQLMFSFHDAPIGELDLGGSVRGKVGYLYNGTAKFDLNIVVVPEAGTLDQSAGDGTMLMEWEYNTDLFDDATIERLSQAYLQLLAALPDGARQARALAELPLDRSQQRTLLRQGDGATASPPRLPAAARPPADLWQAVAAVARRQPDAIAVRWPGGQLSYAGLYSRAGQLAEQLRGLGMGPESVVAVATGRSGAVLIGILGAYAAGAGYLPVDSSQPAGRRELILADSDVTVVLTDAGAGYRDGELAGPGRTMLRLDGADRPAPAGPACVPPPAPAVPGNLAYVLYTSGSTGRPKGVQVSREALSHYLAWCADQYQLGAGDRVPVHTPFGVDLTVTSLLAPLTVGATVELLPDGVYGLEALAETVAAGGADLVKLTPSHLRGLREQLGSRVPPHPVTLVIGGEALYASDIPEWAGRAYNEYGPTEAVVGCAVAELTGAPGGGDPDGATVPAGRPVTHARLAVLDPAGSLAPPGAVGELSIGGAALARGYAGAPAATAAAFRPDPWSETPGARTYRSGDRMRWLPDAALDYLGRFDRQLKVRGHRVDPGEVEAAMLAVADVAAAAVRLAEGSTERLLGYLVPAPGSDPGAVLAAVAEALARQLPEHMVPSVIHTLPTLPMTASGKVDCAALPERPSEPVAAPVAVPATTSHPDPTSSEREREVARIWQEVLQVDRVGPDSDFFALGGHSLAAVRVVVRLRETLQAQVRLHDLFAARTVSRLAARIDREA